MGLHVIQKDLENPSSLITDNALCCVDDCSDHFREAKIVTLETLSQEPWFLQSKIFLDEYICNLLREKHSS